MNEDLQFKAALEESMKVTQKLAFFVFEILPVKCMLTNTLPLRCMFIDTLPPLRCTLPHLLEVLRTQTCKGL